MLKNADRYEWVQLHGGRTESRPRLSCMCLLRLSIPTISPLIVFHPPLKRYMSLFVLLFFQAFSSYDESLSQYCLAHLFTALVNADGILGLSYVASTQRHNPGGICSEGDTTIRTLTPASFAPVQGMPATHI